MRCCRDASSSATGRYYGVGTARIAEDGGDWLMHRRKRSRTTDPALWQAAVLLCVVVADGVLIYALGGPAWLMVLYAVLAVATPAGLLWLSPRPRPPAAPPASSPPAEARDTARRAL